MKTAASPNETQVHSTPPTQWARARLLGWNQYVSLAPGRRRSYCVNLPREFSIEATVTEGMLRP
jgi:hypothetical protein